MLFKIITIVGFMLISAITFSSERKYECMIEPKTVVDLGSAAQGVIEFVSADRGQKVKKNEVIAKLVSNVEKAAVEVARAKVNGTAQQESARIRKSFSERKYKRALDLSNKDHISVYELDEARTEMFLAEQALAEADEYMTLAEAELKQAEALMDLKVIKSPIDGVVINRYMEPGERVENDPIIQIAQINPLYVEVLLPVEMLGEVQLGHIGSVSSERKNGKNYMASVVAIDPVVNAASGFFGVRLSLPNPDLRIISGLECEIEFLAESPN